VNGKVARWFRPGRNQHNALDALYTGLLTKKVNWVLDLDIRSFFDGLSHEWLVKFIEHRIADRRVVRLIQKWLKAGVLEEGKWSRTEEAQGGSASPLLANIYLHYLFDLWAQAWRRKQARGDMIIVRFADDIVVGLQEKSDAERFWTELIERMRKFSLELHPEKTRLLEFGPYAAANRKKRGEGKPETFNFLGCTHICGKKRSNGRFTARRQTIRKRLQAKLSEVQAELQRRMHHPIPEVGQWLRSVVGGHIRYYGVPTNGSALYTFRFQVGRLWHRTLSRRSQNGRVAWDRMRRLINRWLPPARICHPYPLRRMGVITWGKSRMREIRSSGSVEGVVGNHDPYSDSDHRVRHGGDCAQRITALSGLNHRSNLQGRRTWTTMAGGLGWSCWRQFRARWESPLT
jgi:RNA-directed DNA polymerase